MVEMIAISMGFVLAVVLLFTWALCRAAGRESARERERDQRLG